MPFTFWLPFTFGYILIRLHWDLLLKEINKNGNYYFLKNSPLNVKTLKWKILHFIYLANFFLSTKAAIFNIALKLPITLWFSNFFFYQSPDNVARPCGHWQDCSHLPDKRYPDIYTNCTSYYTCHGGTFFGHNYCNPGKW